MFVFIQRLLWSSVSLLGTKVERRSSLLILILCQACSNCTPEGSQRDDYEPGWQLTLLLEEINKTPVSHCFVPFFVATPVNGESSNFSNDMET